MDFMNHLIKDVFLLPRCGGELLAITLTDSVLVLMSDAQKEDTR